MAPRPIPELGLDIYFTAKVAEHAKVQNSALGLFRISAH